MNPPKNKRVMEKIAQRKASQFMFFAWCCQGYESKENAAENAGNVTSIYCRTFAEKSYGTRHLVRQRRTWEVYIEVNVREMGYEDTFCIHYACELASGFCEHEAQARLKMCSL